LFLFRVRLPGPVFVGGLFLTALVPDDALTGLIRYTLPDVVWVMVILKTTVLRSTHTHLWRFRHGPPIPPCFSGSRSDTFGSPAPPLLFLA
jgi:hypothetical protein